MLPSIRAAILDKLHPEIVSTVSRMAACTRVRNWRLWRSNLIAQRPQPERERAVLNEWMLRCFGQSGIGETLLDRQRWQGCGVVR